MMAWRKYVTRSLNLYKLDMYVKAIRSGFKKHLDFDVRNFLVHSVGLESAWYFDDKEFQEWCDIIRDYFLACINENKDPFELLDKALLEFWRCTSEISKRDHRNREELVDSYMEFLEKLEDYALVLWIPVAGDESFFPYAQDRLKEFSGDIKAWDVITDPYESSIITEEYIDLLKVAIDYSDEKLQKHKEKYTYLSMRFVEDIPLELDYFKKRLSEIKNPQEELDRITKDFEIKKKRFYGLLDYLNVDEDDRKLFIYINQLNQLRQRRDEGRRKAYYFASPFFSKILEALDCDYETLFKHTNEEVLEALKKGEKLTDEYIHLHKDGNFELIKNNVRQKLRDEGILPFEDQEATEIKGMTACPGKVTGKIKLIRLNSVESDVANLQKGDILVAITTKPDYIVAMERAAAFITDEGGITSHAAIVAREMQKPCIIGTKNATKVLKDGDMVEVDADKGIVKKI